MVQKVVERYIKRRLNSGDSISEIKDHLLSAGYTPELIAEIVDSIESHIKLPEKMLSINPKVLTSYTPLKKLKKEIKKYSKLIILSGVIIFATLIGAILLSIDFSQINWAHRLITGAVYLSSFAIFVIIQSLLIYSIHKSSLSRSPLHINITPIIIALLVGQALTYLSAKFLPGIFLSILLGCLVFAAFLLASFSSKGSEILSASVIYFALTYFYYILIFEVYTYERILTIFGVL